MSKRLARLMLLASVIACTARDERSAVPPAMPQEGVEAARRAIDDYVIAFWIKRDTTALARSMSPTMIYHYNGESEPTPPAGHLSALRDFGGAFPDLTATVDVVVASGDLAAAVTTWTGTFTGTYCKTPGQGQRLSWAVNYVFRLVEGRIVEMWETFDEGGLFRKLGIDIANCR